MATKWFAVKTFFRSTTEGAPSRPDRFYDPDSTMVEERLLMFKAKTEAEAIRKAEREAKDYARQTEYMNPYGQKVITRYLGYYDISEIEGSPANGKEMFVKSRLMSRRVKDSKVAFLYIGKNRGTIAKTKRKKFINRDYFNESIS